MRFGKTSREVRSTFSQFCGLLYTGAEAQTRQAFLATLTVDVVNALTSLKVRLTPSSPSCESVIFGCKETQERTRKRIKEDLKESGVAYTDYAENTLPKLKRTYLKKCQEVEVSTEAIDLAVTHGMF
jgi:hypothetical protein